MNNKQPNYKKIYTDIILMKHPDKLDTCQGLLEKKEFSTLDVIKLNQMVFGLKESNSIQLSQKHKSYDKSAIMEILEYQKKSGRNNTQVARQFNISRNSLAKWKKLFFHECE
ncbi:helix-turn-helix domain-containing protein [Chryseobacterium sp. PMSZPI]|uniref:helix-turn-helix domain-containing protein n=1 Tax=Chryseobacterium sp. PMSZPI TaxID=1033900 RepID=UPI000C33AE2F|nr:helix-turn-helix domain-containing protein [Chryseobacterium sp. PMSZPI]PKF75437.1 transposase [Chryseobacterium sp. PMSZPI]